MAIVKHLLAGVTCTVEQRRASLSCNTVIENNILCIIHKYSETECSNRRESIHAHIICMEHVLHAFHNAGFTTAHTIALLEHVSMVRISYGLSRFT